MIHLKANYWAERGVHKISIVTTEQMDNSSFYPLHENVELHDLGVNYNRNKSYFRSTNFPLVVKNLIRLRRLLKIIRPDIVIVANHIPVSFFFPLLGISAKFVKEFHFSKFYRSKLKPTLFTKIEAHLEARYDFLVVLNKEEREFYHSNNVVHISNPIQIPEDEEHVNTSRNKVAIAAGRISEVKRFDILIEIWSKFSKLNPDWKLNIYGEGNQHYIELLNDRIKELHLENRIEIKKSTNNLRAVMRSSGLYLMTSAQECFPMVLLEAQSCGLPIIAYDCPTGPRNIITHNKDGVLVTLDDENSFVKELIRLTSKNKIRQELAANGYENVKRFAMDNIMTEWEEKIIKS